MSLYADNGSINVTVVDGTNYTGIYAVDGSINVVKSSGSEYVGLYHPCGAFWVTVSPDTFVSMRAPDGSMYVTEGTTGNSGVKITVVSGSLTDTSGLVWGTSKLLWSTDRLTWS